MLSDQFSQARILIIDDDVTNVRYLELLLKRSGFSNLRATRDSSEAMNHVKEFQPDIILLDLHMPGLDGFDVIRQFREANSEETFPPILVLTADTTAGAKNKALAMGAKDFLSKPLDTIEVTLRVRNLLETRFLQQKLTETLENRRANN